MPPKKGTCSCRKHAIYSDGKTFSVSKLTSRKHLPHLVKLLEHNSDLSTRALYLCTACVEFADEHLVPSVPPPAKKATVVHSSVKNVIENLNTDILSSLDKITLYTALGEVLATDFSADAANVSQAYKNLETLSSFDSATWIAERNNLLVSFLRAVCMFDDNDKSPKKLSSFTKAIEQLMFCRNNNIIAPLSFTCNLLTYFATGSKVACTLQSSTGPAGSYTSILNWLNDQTAEPLTCPRTDSVVTFFDNNQVVEKNWRVQLNYKTSVSTITTIVHVQQPGNEVQQSLHMSPSQWLNVDCCCDSIIRGIISYQSTALVFFQSYRRRFIEERIAKVVKEQTTLNNITTDYVDSGNHVSTSNTVKSAHDPYTHIDSGHPATPPLVSVGDPLMKNPNSFNTVCDVMKSIMTTCGVGHHSEWTTVGCDGLPYGIGAKIIENYFTCPACSHDTKTGKQTFSKHMSQCHPDVQYDMNHCRTFKDLLLVPGLGHFEMNMVKGIFKLAWHILLSDMANMLGFRTDRALARRPAAITSLGR
jgi:hypothetical protein